MRAATFGMGLASAVAGCAGSPPASPVPVADVIANIRSWDGEIVNVDGWLGPCADHGCHIFGSPADMRAVVTYDVGSGRWFEAHRRSVSIGSTEAFDRAAAPLQFSHVRLKARINKKCWPANCLDRADILQPISIARAN